MVTQPCHANQLPSSSSCLHSSYFLYRPATVSSQLNSISTSLHRSIPFYIISFSIIFLFIILMLPNSSLPSSVPLQLLALGLQHPRCSLLHTPQFFPFSAPSMLSDSSKDLSAPSNCPNFPKTACLQY